MKIPVFLPVTREFGFRDEFAQDCLLHRRVVCEPYMHADRLVRHLFRTGPAACGARPAVADA